MFLVTNFYRKYYDFHFIEEKIKDWEVDHRIDK